MERKWKALILVDGYNGGVAHITADQIRDHNIAMYGDGDYVLPVGDKFAYEIVNNNTINMSSGMVVMCGARAVTGYGKTEVLTIENGTSGYKRADIIVAEYSKDNETLVESVTVKVVKGTLGSAYSDPALVTGDIRAGATKRQMALYRVKVNGLSIEAVEKMWTASNGAAMNKLMKIPASELSFLTGNGTGDTPTNWAKVGMGMAYFSTEGMLENQPMKYGWLINYTAGSSIVAQQFIGLNGNSPVYYRSGNASGWYPGSKGWVRSLDEKNGAQINKVWQNASPSSLFPPQDVAIAANEGNLIGIEFESQTVAKDRRITWIPIKSGFTTELVTIQSTSDGGNIFVTRRAVTITNAGSINFDKGYYRYVGESNNRHDGYSIPTAVYIAKGVI